MTISIEESGMIFGPFEDEKIFQIETSPLFTRLGKGLKIAEFVLLRDFPAKPREAWFIEAKSNAPLQHAVFVEEIRQKFTNSVQLTFAACLKRHGQAEEHLSEAFVNLNLETCTLKCVLVINKFPKAWMPALRDSLNKAMSSLTKTMGFKPGSIIVINDEMARAHNLIN